MKENESQIDIIDPIIENKPISGDYWKNKEFYTPKTIRRLHAMIYDWLCNHYGPEEAQNPYWSIVALANYLHENLLDDYEQQDPVVYTDDCEMWEDECDEYNK